MKTNENQCKVINSNKNLMVLASAGCGKTFCIVQKIRKLEINIKQNDILIISFTNKTVDDLKQKLPNYSNIFTFHKLAINILDNSNCTYKLCSDSLLKYIIKEYFFNFITSKEKTKLLLYYYTFNYNTFLKSNNFKTLINLIYSFIKMMQCNNLNKIFLKDIYLKTSHKFLVSIIFKIYNIYINEKSSQNLIDLDDLIIKAADVSKNIKFNYKYIFLDEFQDSSMIRFNLIYNIFINSNSIINFFGDDFQSIYAFSGCNLNIMLNIKDKIKNIEFITLDTNYRSDNKLIRTANEFIMRNKKQIPKNIHSNQNIINSINFVYYNSLHTKLYSLIDSINSEDIMVLGRYNSDIMNIDKSINSMTIHQSKGLEADYVIIINNTSGVYGFPSKIKNSELLNYFTNEENILYAEERRLFYVAITRARKKVFLLVPYHNKSVFIKEYKKIVQNYN